MQFLNTLALGSILFLVSSCLPIGEHCPEEDYAVNNGGCYVTPDPGPCEAQFIKYYYDASEGKCKEFVWGGCDGSVPFHTLKDCQDCAGTSNGNTNTPSNGGVGSLFQ